MSYELYHDPNTKKTLKKLEIIRTTIQALQCVLDLVMKVKIQGQDLYTDLNEK